LSSVLKVLNNQVWAPIEKALPAGTTTVIVSPDADLSFVSFAKPGSLFYRLVIPVQVKPEPAKAYWACVAVSFKSVRKTCS